MKGDPSLRAAPAMLRLREVPIRLRLLAQLRWIAIAGQLLCLPAALATGWLPEAALARYLGVVAVLVLANVWVARRTADGDKESAAQGHLVLLHLGMDVLCFAALLSMAGGLHNPFSALLVVHAALAALLIEGRVGLVGPALVVAVVALVASTGEPVPATVGRPPVTVHTIAALSVVAMVVWAMMAWLVAAMDRHRATLDDLRRRQHEIDRLRALGALAGGMSHRLASPLTTLRLRVDRLARRVQQGGQETPESPAADDIAQARAAIGECERVLRRIAAGTSGDGQDVMRVELGEFVAQVCRSWARHEDDVRVCCQDGDLTSLASPVALGEALIDLLDNAAHAGGTATPPQAIEVEVARDAGWLRVSVHDRGPGWPDEVLDRIGEPFVTTRDGGHGLGVYNAATVATAFGGRFRATQRPGGGASAHIDLPPAPPAHAAAPP